MKKVQIRDGNPFYPGVTGQSNMVTNSYNFIQIFTDKTPHVPAVIWVNKNNVKILKED